MTPPTPTIESLLLDLESHFAVPASTANEAHHQTVVALTLLITKARIDELKNCESFALNENNFKRFKTRKEQLKATTQKEENDETE